MSGIVQLSECYNFSTDLANLRQKPKIKSLSINAKRKQKGKMEKKINFEKSDR